MEATISPRFLYIYSKCRKLCNNAIHYEKEDQLTPWPYTHIAIWIYIYIWPIGSYFIITTCLGNTSNNQRNNEFRLIKKFYLTSYLNKGK